MRNGPRTLTTVIALTLLAAPAAAEAQGGYGTPIRLFGDRSAVLDASSGPDHGLALRLLDLRARERHSVRFQDSAGRWHRFTVPGGPQTVRLARLEDGGGLAAWDEGDTVHVRTWTRDGALSPARTVLTDVETIWSGDFDAAGWDLAHDGAGTVAIAAPGPGGSVVATVRDAGGDFTPPQQLLAPTGALEPPSLALVGPEPDGTVSVFWGQHSDGPDPIRGRETAHATRAGRATTFAPVEAGGRAADATLLAAGEGRDVRVGPSVLALCMRVTCSKPSLFAWGASAAVIAFQRVDLPTDDPGRWYVASRQPDGRFDRPRLAFRGDANPVWTRAPGVLTFTRVSEGDSAGRERGTYLVRFGGAPSKARPRLFAQEAFSRNGTLTVTAFCRTACRISASGFKAAARRTLAPLEPGALTMRVPATRKVVHVTLVARDARGRRTRLERTLRRGPLVTGSLREWRVTR